MSASPTPEAAPRSPRPRRTDPHRRERIVAAALEVLAEHGVAGTTHRRVAAAADVPLGSTTYHFASLADLRAAAYHALSERVSQQYEAALAGARTPAQLVDAVTDLVMGDAGAGAADWSVTYELYLEALKDPALREVTEGWMATSRRVLERVVDPATARGLDALVEGLVMHRLLSTAPMGRDVVREAVRRAVGAPPDDRAPGAAASGGGATAPTATPPETPAGRDGDPRT
ncbi:TetR family transcriptional regulator C-terminal domain-containing protein [uncultured Pseudokineococcus sp.]|uniref:TetR/AcrR family transcriptional regulator n=1 Tax=uncultured Pseudokineococcus sp. TaxID=1642928 RepID=UPI002606CC00|nr:TetR family transcriptional regulator C-terminal domain-containing protein [uncultured Pseudokineococcus sp.]